MDIIKFSDLFDEGGINSGLKGLVTQVEGVKGSLLEMLKEVKDASASIAQSLSSTTSTTKGGRDDTKQQAANVEQLYSAYQELTKAIAECDKNIVAIYETLKKKKPSDAPKDTLTLAESYATLSDLISKTGVSINELLTSQKQLNIAQKNGEVAAKSATGSYNQLYAQYNLIKNVLNAMSTEMRNAEGVGKVWEAEALRIMNVMKGMQEATGKHTLSVGDYTKAFNGLSIATQQVLREMPTLANSWSQFFIAISNNVPIFLDNLKAVYNETKSFSTTMKAVLSSVFSWQTLLLGLLTILPKVAKALSDKKKAQEEEAKAQAKAEKEAAKASSSYRTLADIYLDISKSAENAVTELKVLNGIIDDTNRAWSERVDAGKRLKEIFKDELEGFNAEEIAMGKARVTMMNLTTQVYEQAKARATLNQIAELSSKILELQDRAKLYENFRYGTKTVKELSDALDEAGKKGKRVYIGAAEQEAVDTYRSIMSEMRGLQKQMDKLTAQVKPGNLLDDGGKGKKTLDKSLDYYWEWKESVASIIDDAEERELTLNDVKYEKSKATYQKILAEATATYKEIINKKKAGAALTNEEKKYITDYKEQQQYLTGIINNLETERQQERLAIIDKYYQLEQAHYRKVRQGILDSYDELLVVEEEKLDEEDFTISGKYDKILANISTQITAARENLNDTLVNGTYEEAKEEGAILKRLLTEKIKAEGEYKKEVLKMRLETGAITQEQYEIELAKINAAIDKAISQLTGKNRRKMDIWDLLLGKTQKDEYGNVFKKLDDEGKAFVNQLIDSLGTAMEYMDEFMDKRIEMAEIAVEAAQKESEAAKSALESEMEARANGYANNVDLARREYEEKLALEEKAVEEKKRLQKIQEGIDTLTQISSLVTATAQLWASYSSLPGIGQALALAAIAAMWGSFAAAKIQAAQLANAKTYGEGGTEYINYGGSHASGNDVDFGRTKDGRARRVEKGEVVSVINKKNVEKYGVSRIENIINALNNGTFEKQYISSKSASILSSKSASILSSKSSLVESTERNNIADMYSLAFSMLGLPTEGGADLSTIEKGIKTLVSQNEVRVVPTPYGRIEYRGNNTRIIRNS